MKERRVLILVIISVCAVCVFILKMRNDVYHDTVKEDDLLLFDGSEMDKEEVSVAFSVVSEFYAQQALVMMKTIVLFTTSPIQFHTFSDEPTIHYIKQQLALYPLHYGKRFTYKCYNIEESYAVIKDKVADLNHFEHFGPAGGSLRLLMPQLLSDIEKLIVLDTDLIFLGDITELYEQFQKFHPHHIIGMGPEGFTYLKPINKQRFYGDYGLNAGVILMNIRRANEVSFIDKILDYYKTESDSIISHHEQGLLNLYFADHPYQIYDLPCRFMFHGDIDHCSYIKSNTSRMCLDRDLKGAFILHGTCGRFSSKEPTPPQKEHMAGYVLPAKEQGEYRLLYEWVHSLDLSHPYSAAQWRTLYRDILKVRQDYCNSSDDWIIKQLNESVSLLSV